MIALALGAGAAALLLLALLRLLTGPTLHDRALAAKSIVLRAALICAAIAVAAGESVWIDAAFALVFGALVVMTAALKIFRTNTFQAPLARPLEDA
ncbi:MAG: hypothetical protein KJZ75_14695 [Hyphomonadaceae bacterium]|nr:hypothetical protein [Hyphomonadaceae bacterium]GIK49786.1 MAG: hypothetical protein BroJett013_24830 [Alphaproteobacteria bacterium]